MKGQLDLCGESVTRVAYFFGDALTPFLATLRDLQRVVNPSAPPMAGDEIHRRLSEQLQWSFQVCNDFEASCNGNGEFLRTVQHAFRQLTDPCFRESWYAHRARTKPSGFAGDFQMLLTLYRGQTPALGLGGYLDLCLGELPLAKAVVTRLASLRQFLLEWSHIQRSRVRILNIACGPCHEYNGWPRDWGGPQLEVIAVDNDPAALDYLRQHVVPRLPAAIELHPVHYNALRTCSADANRKRFGPIDMIYSVGLCDYLPDRVLVELLRGWYETLQENGTLYVAFKDADRYDKTPYQWHLDWYFYQRTYADVLQLYRKAGLNTDELVMHRDASGIIMNCVLHKPAGRILRVDAEEQAKPAVERTMIPTSDRAVQP